MASAGEGLGKQVDWPLPEKQAPGAQRLRMPNYTQADKQAAEGGSARPGSVLVGRCHERVILP